MKKKILSTLLAAAMTVSCLPSVLAATAIKTGTPNDWTYQNTNVGYVTNEKSHSGEYSLKVNGGTNTDMYLWKNAGVETGDYKVTMYINGTFAAPVEFWQIQVRFESGTQPGHLNMGEGEVPGCQLTKEKQPDGWWKVSYIAKNPSGAFTVRGTSRSDGYYIDDITIKKLDESGNETGDNLLENSGFESVTVNNTIKPTLSLAASDKKITVTMKNPPVASTAAVLYLDGDEVSVDNLNLEANAENVAELEVENYVEHTIKYVTTTAEYGDLSDEAVTMAKEALTGLKIGNPDGWKKKGNISYYVTSEKAHSGNMALRVTYGAGSENWVQNSVPTEEGKYRVTMYITDLTGNWWWTVQARFEGGNQPGHLNMGEGEVPGCQLTKEEQPDGWWKVSYIVTNPTGIFRVGTSNNQTQFTIDDISVVKIDDNGNALTGNLMTNGSFESYSEYNPTINAAENDGLINISVTNPPVTATDVKLYIDGTETELDEKNLTAGGVSTKAYATENFKYHTIRAVCVTASGELENTIRATARNEVKGVPSSWGGQTTTADSYSGKSSLYMKGKADGTELLQNFTGDITKTYRVTVYAKFLPNADYGWMGKVWIGAESGAGANKVSHLNEEGWTRTQTDRPGWIKYESTYQPGNDSTNYIHIKSQSIAPEFEAYIDDLSIYEWDGEKTVGENLAVNGGFEDYTELSYGEGVKYGYIEDGYLYLTFDDNNRPVPDLYKLYTVNGGTETYVCNIEGDFIDLTETGIEYDENTIFAVKSYYTGAGKETAGVIIKDGVYTDGLFGSGTINESGNIEITGKLSKVTAGNVVVGVDVGNNTPNALTPVVYAALYNNGKLVGVQKLSTEIAARKSAELAAMFVVPEITDGDNYTAKAFTWDSEMCPYAGAFSF